LGNANISALPQHAAGRHHQRQSFGVRYTFGRRNPMATISLARKHGLSHKKAKDAAEKIAKDLRKRFELDYAWDGDHIDFERPGVSGRMAVTKDKIALDVNLGWLLTPLKPAIEKEITSQLDKLTDSKA
jgi:putative polyhydroxyalkanoate system protein